MAGQKQSPKHAENRAKFLLKRAEALELARIERQQRRDRLAQPVPYKRGSASSYNPDKAQEICDRIINGESLTEICRDHKHLPSYATAIRWLQDHPTFRDSFKIAIELSAHVEADQMSILRRAALRGDIEPDTARVTMSASQWLAAKRNAALYGDKSEKGANSDVPPIVNLTLQRVGDK